MKKTAYLFLAVFFLIASAFVFLNDWQIKEDGCIIKFDTKKASGTIGGLKGKIQFDKSNLTKSSFDVTVDVNTLNTGNNLKNQHAKAKDFLNVEQYPTIRFVSDKIDKIENGYQVLGKLTIKEVSKEVAIPFTFKEEKENTEACFEGKFEINTEDFKLKKKGVGGKMTIVLKVPVKQE
jgi:polyisoprenoid-binding protein YceI